MKPRDLLVQCLESEAVPALQQHGFAWSKSQLHFSRKSGIARQCVSFSLEKWNRENSCRFWTMWGATAAAYGRWHKATFGFRSPSNAIGGCADWNIPGWKCGPVERRHLTGSRRDAIEIAEFLLDFTTAGLPYLESFSTWSGAAAHCLEDPPSFCRAADLFLIAERAREAKDALLSGLRRFAVLGMPDQHNQLPSIRERLDRFFPDWENALT